MKLVARAVTALAVLALATPALPCGFEKSTTTATAPAPAPAGQVAKADKAKPAKAQKAATKAPARGSTATASN